MNNYCLTCKKYFNRNRCRSYCSRVCWFKSDRLKLNGVITGNSLAGKPSNNPHGNGGATKGMKATSTQLEGLRVGWLLKGEQKGSWKGGATLKNWGLHRTNDYRLWRKKVLMRDRYKCLWCGSKENLQADHIKPAALFPELSLDIKNGRTLCVECHKKTETYAGKLNRFIINMNKQYGVAW